MKQLGTILCTLFLLSAGIPAEMPGGHRYYNKTFGLELTYPSDWVSVSGSNEDLEIRDQRLSELVQLEQGELQELYETYGLSQLFSAVKPQKAGGPPIPTSLVVSLMPFAHELWETDPKQLARQMAEEALELYTDATIEIDFTPVKANTECLVYRLSGRAKQLSLSQSFIIFRPKPNLTCGIILTSADVGHQEDVDQVLASVSITLP